MPVSKRLTAALLATSLLATTACVTNPETGEREFPVRTAVGTGIGALGGYLLGDLIAGGRSSAIAAGIGAIAGGAVGQYMDRQEARLRQQTAGSGIDVVRSGDEIILRMPNEAITFAYNRAEVQAQDFATLNQVAGVLREFPSTAIDIYGHTDSTGSDAYNQGLSERRAQSVADYLVAQGVNRVRMATRGFGEQELLRNPERSEADRQANRRVEIRIAPVTQ
ncbi:MAG TPA: OmpA family protein [Allosphingosinicella sp.]|nr:OmpA family protein [Allosphingosinicella sp.]